ncbi:hypothetical protein Sango_2834500, partial [Sesamum angolense]
SLCDEVECGKGSCEAAPGYPFNFRCVCQDGWKRTRLDDEQNLEFLPCIIPNCSLDYSCMPAPPPVPPTPYNLSFFDRAIGSESCQKLGISVSKSSSGSSPADNSNHASLIGSPLKLDESTTDGSRPILYERCPKYFSQCRHLRHAIEECRDGKDHLGHTEQEVLDHRKIIEKRKEKTTVSEKGTNENVAQHHTTSSDTEEDASVVELPATSRPNATPGDATSAD